MKLDVNSLVFYAVSDSSWTKESTLLQQVHAAYTVESRAYNIAIRILQIMTFLWKP